MAYIQKEKNGTYSIRFQLDKKAKTLYGFSNERTAQRTGEKIEELKTDLATGGLSNESRMWLAKTEKESPKLYDKLSQWGLAKSRVKPRTLGDLLDAYAVSGDVTEETRKTWKKVTHNLKDFFGADKSIETIDRDDADEYARWLATAPLNRRTKKPTPYATGTVLRRITQTKTVFTFAVRKGWIQTSPFSLLKSGESANLERMEYVTPEVFNAVIASLRPSQLRWKLLFMLGRYAGIRGSSEVFQMQWEDVHDNEPDGQNRLVIRAWKNRRHGRLYRSVPLAPALRDCLREWHQFVQPGATHVFPGLKNGTNFSERTTQLVTKSGIPGWEGRWYDLRRSFCCDLLESGIDVAGYEYMADHSYTVGKRHYQIMHKGRELRAIGTANALFSRFISADEAPKNHSQNFSQERYCVR